MKANVYHIAGPPCTDAAASSRTFPCSCPCALALVGGIQGEVPGSGTFNLECWWAAGWGGQGFRSEGQAYSRFTWTQET